MRSSSRLVILAIIVLVAISPACKKDTPPAPAPAPPPAAPPPAAPMDDTPAEPPAAGEWETSEPAEETFLSVDEINSRRLLKTIFFDYDKAEIRPDQRATLQANAVWLRDNDNVRVLIEGHCDERGTREYNLALGDRRAQATRDYMVSLGIDAGRIETISYGEEQPVATGEGEANWSQNRRSLFQAISTEPRAERRSSN